MACFDVVRVSATIWKWLCTCPDAIGHDEDSSSNDDFFTPPSTLVRCAEDQHVANIPESPLVVISPTSDVQRLLSPA